MIDPEIRDDDARHVPERTVRQFGALLALVLLAFAVRAGLEGSAIRAGGWAVAGIAAAVGGVVRPSIVRPLFTGSMIATTPIRLVVSHALLAVMYYGIFTPLAVIFRLIGRDALARRRRRADSYWEPKAMPSDIRSYFRQS